MYVDLLDANNYLMINVSLVKTLGLSGAAYCSELFSILKKATTKKKLVEDYCIKVDRDYIQSRTSLTAEEQLKIEDAWMKLDLISKSNQKTDTFSINVPKFICLVTGSDVTKDNLTKTELAKLKSQLNSKTSKKQSIKSRLKDHIATKVDDAGLLDKLYTWVDVIMDNKRPLSKEAVNMFIDKLTEYSSDSSIILKLVDIAIVHAYVDCTWAINAYEKDNKLKEGSTFNRPRTTTQRRATKDDISGGDKF